MHKLVCRLAALMVVTVGAAHGPLAMAQTDDDWAFAQDASKHLTVAEVRYTSGHAIIVQCAGEELKIGLTGLPPTTRASRLLGATRADGATDTQSWLVGEDGTLISALPARDARFMRVGGKMQFRSTSGQASPIEASFDLPTQHANLDRVLTACGYPLQDDRDALPRAAPDLRLLRTPQAGDIGGRPGRSLEMSCIIQGGAYGQCRADHLLKGQSARDARRDATGRNGSRLHPDDMAANEGKVAYIFVPLLMVVEMR